MESMPVKATDSNVDGVVVREDTYLAMTPAKSLSSLSNSGLRNPHHKTSLLSAHNSITSLTSSHGSSQLITSQNFQRFNNADKNFFLLVLQTCGQSTSKLFVADRICSRNTRTS